MNCPKGHGELKAVNVGSIRIEQCPRCGGAWYDSGELRILKDKEASGDYCWIDFDLWKDADKFRAARQQRYDCPSDSTKMTTVHYGESPVTVDICSQCRGIWLDKHEYDEIVRYLDEMVDTHSIRDYLRDIREEFLEVLTGREDPVSELKNLSRVLYLMELRFVVEHPTLRAVLNALPRF
jgi:Zn-finger nucleic acid-binding protein